MKKTLQKMFIFLVALSVPLGFFIDHDHGPFWWHRLPMLDGIVGGMGALILLALKKWVASFASRSEDFYD